MSDTNKTLSAEAREKIVLRAYELFDKFHEETKEFRRKCVSNEEFWKSNHWYDTNMAEQGEPRPVTPVLFSTLESLLADIMDNYPQPLLLGEEPSDDKLAQKLSDIVRFILKRRNYRSTYRKKCRQALKKGVSVQEVFWDNTLYGGLGDVNIRAWDIKNFLWDTSCEDIQEGRACFKYAFYPREWFLERYPDKVALMRSDGYYKDDYLDTGYNDDELMIMEYWYKKYDPKSMKLSVHCAKISGHVLLECSEDVRSSMYEHGMYPFVMEPLFQLEGQPIGLGIIDVFKNLQLYADKLDQIVLKNALMSGKMKMLVNRGAELDEAALTDWSQEVVRGNRVDDGSVRWFQPAQLNPALLAHFNQKLSTIKEESGQTQFMRGEVAKGVTAASAILALQEAGSKRSRAIIDGMYDGFEELVRMVIMVIGEFYTEKRVFRILGDEGAVTQSLSGNMLKRVSQDVSRNIEFDISVTAEKLTPHRTLYQNELAVQLLQNGVIQPADALGMMIFDGKEQLLQKVLSREEAESNQPAEQAN